MELTVGLAENPVGASMPTTGDPCFLLLSFFQHFTLSERFLIGKCHGEMRM